MLQITLCFQWMYTCVSVPTEINEKHMLVQQLLYMERLSFLNSLELV